MICHTEIVEYQPDETVSFAKIVESKSALTDSLSCLFNFFVLNEAI